MSCWLQPINPWSVGIVRVHIHSMYTELPSRAELFVEFSLLTKSLYTSELVPTKNMQSAEDQELQLVHLSMHLRKFAVRHQLLASERSLHMAAQQRHELAAEVRNLFYFLTYAVAVARYLHTASRY